MARSNIQGFRLDDFFGVWRALGYSEWRNYVNADTKFDAGRPEGRHAWLVFPLRDVALEHGVPASTRETWNGKKGLQVPSHNNHHLDGEPNQHCFMKRGAISYAKYWEQRPLSVSWPAGFACVEPDQEWAETVRVLAGIPGGKARYPDD